MAKIGWLEYAEHDTVHDYQSTLLKKTVEYVYTYSAYYRNLFDEIGLSPADIQSIEDIKKIPITTKQDLEKYAEDFRCCDPTEVLDIAHTSGTTGVNPIVNTLNKSDVNRLAYNEELSFKCAGIKENDVVTITTAIEGFYIAGLAYYLGLKRIGATILRVDPFDLGEQYNLLSKFPITGIVGVPSNLIKLGEYCNKKGLNLKETAVQKLVLIGETIRERNFALNKLGENLQSLWPKSKLYSTYGNTELATAFCECEAQMGGHCHPDLSYVEVLNENEESVSPGEIGDLVISTYNTNGMPVLRYQTSDISFVATEKCSCGRTSLRIGPILGRRANMLKVRGVSIYPNVIEEGILGVDGVKDYVVVITNGDRESDEIQIYLTATDLADDEYICKRVAENVRRTARTTPKVQKCEDEELKKMQYKTGSRKARRFYRQGE